MNITALHSDRTQFSLYLRTREAAAVQRVLKQIQKLKQHDREAWLLEHGELFHEAFEHFIDNSSETLSGIQLTDESLNLSEELIVALQDSARSIEVLFGDTTQLKG